MPDGPRAIDAGGEHREVVVLVAEQIARAGAERDADAVTLDVAVEEAGVVERFARGEHAELIAARPAAPLERCQLRGEREEIDFGGDAAAEAGGVEQRHRANAAEAREHVLPHGFAR